MLPTKESRIQLIGKKLVLFDNLQYADSGYISQHLYITSNEEIKDGDYATDGTTIFHVTNQNLWNFKTNKVAKVIATTDKSLCKSYNNGARDHWDNEHKVAKIPTSFIQ